MSTLEEADSCIKYLNRSVLEGRVIIVEKVKYCHLIFYSFAECAISPSYTSDRDRSYSPDYRRRAYSPYYRRRRSQSVSRYSSRRRSYSRDSRSYSSGCSGSPYCHRRCEHSWSRSISPRSRYRRHYSRSISPRRSSRRGFSHSHSPRDQRSRISYSRSPSPRDQRLRRSYSRNYSPRYRKYSAKVQPSKRSPSSSNSSGPIERYSRESYAHSHSASSSSSSRSRSPA
ncbi:hypothetical protein BHE74_00036796, partial [Ensete ventricosum]